MLQTFGLSHINLPVRNLEESVRFYAGLLGAKEIRRFDDCVMLRTPGTHEVITLTGNATEAEILSKSEGFHFGFRLRECQDIGEVAKELTRLGATGAEHGGSKEKGRLYAFARDPNGYTVEVFWEND